jgi:hypothetical protein
MFKINPLKKYILASVCSIDFLLTSLEEGIVQCMSSYKFFFSVPVSCRFFDTLL